MPNAAYYAKYEYKEFLDEIQKTATDIETLRITFRQIAMVICRYSTKGVPLAYYTIDPCTQLSDGILMLLSENGFYTLNIATLLMEMAAEYDLRQEEFHFYSKQLMLNKIKATTIQDMELKLWNDRKLENKIQEYISKDYCLDEVICHAMRPWLQTVEQYLNAVTQRSLLETNPRLVRNSTYPDFTPSFVDTTIRPALLPDMLCECCEGEDDNGVIIEYRGERLLLWYSTLYPNVNYSPCRLEKLSCVSVNALIEYMKLLPKLSEETDIYMQKVIKTYDKVMMQNKDYASEVGRLLRLAAKHEGTPVCRFLRYLRWQVDRVQATELFNNIIVIDDRTLYFVINHTSST